MNTLARRSIRLFLLAVWVGASLRANGSLGFFSSIPDVLTVTDTTEEGRSWPVPELGKPVFYEAISFGSRNFPGLRGDVAPNTRAMTDLIVKTLAEQGFQRALKRGVAKVFLSISWGYSRANLGSLGFLGGDKLDLMSELGNDPSSNALARWIRPLTAEKIMEAANSDLYIASIQAFDLKKLDAGEKVLLWHTRIACEARGLYMTDALPTMIMAAGPFIGRETKKPVWRDANDLKKAHIDFGQLKTIELIQPSPEKGSAGEATKK